jgi:hypothetical protein
VVVIEGLVRPWAVRAKHSFLKRACEISRISK